MKLTKPERKFIAPALLLDLDIQYVGLKGKCYWDGDTLMPVKVGNVCKSLIRKGLLEEVGVIRSTKLSEKYKCKNTNCIKGRIEIYDEYEDDYICKGDCPVCEGIGVLDLPKN